MIEYCLKSIVCLTVFWGFYTLFLESEKLHHFKRFYLLGSIVLALIIPTLTFSYDKEIIVFEKDDVVVPEQHFQESYADHVSPTLPDFNQPQPEKSDYLTWGFLLWSVYLLGVLIFGVRYIYNLIRIYRQIRTNQTLKSPSHIKVLLNQDISPHTFLHYIFISRIAFIKKQIPEEVMLHEKTHVSQKHTLDILFIEILQVVFWFNPIFYFYKRSIRLNHEFLADQQVIRQKFSIRNYIELLLTYNNSPNQAVLSSPINYSLTKKRLQMMTTNFSKKRVALKMFALIPLLILCSLLFNQEIIAREVVTVISENSKELNSKTTKSSDIKNGITYKASNAMKTFQDGVSNEEMSDYKKWSEKIKSDLKKGTSVQLKKEEVDRMKQIYNTMSVAQKNNVISFEEVVPKPPSPPSAPEAMDHVPSPPAPPGEGMPEVPEIPEPDEMQMDIDIDFEMETVEIDEKEIQREVAQAMREAEQDIAEAQVEIEEALAEAEQGRIEALSEIAEIDQFESSIGGGQLSEEQKEHIRYQAREHAKTARMHAMQAAANARKHAMKAAANARKHAMLARREAHKNAMQARKHVMETRKHAMEARQKHNSDRHRHHSSLEMIRKYAKENAEFIYKGQSISSKEAMQIVRNAGNRLSINAKTKNGKSRVKIKD